ncbi:MAG: peptide chain release factor N(5)-glutamine methyltransferase [Leptolyngbyaceae cyanobacterium bins.59]|nr:peptide chain release factor N(5)-glutamine methyltransferase [Leptolyngbyaceae cyanobacterium bins.59]
MMGRSDIPQKSGNAHLVVGAEFGRWFDEAQAKATSEGVPLEELYWFLLELTDLDRLSLRLRAFQTAPTVPLKLPFPELVHRWEQRLHQRIPVQYLVGRVHWRNFSLLVSPAVLIPRPETELIVDLAVAAIQQVNSGPGLDDVHHWADLGTGSGAIALGLAAEFAQVVIHAVDRSSEALEVARANAALLHLHNRVHFYQGVWFEPLQPFKGRLAGMVSNPPYIPSPAISELEPEVAHHEPHLALNGGPDGLNCLRELVESAPDYLRPDGFWIVEVMAGQADWVAQRLHQRGYHQIQIHRDLAGIDRFVSAHCPSS